MRRNDNELIATIREHLGLSAEALIEVNVSAQFRLSENAKIALEENPPASPGIQKTAKPGPKAGNDKDIKAIRVSLKDYANSGCLHENEEMVVRGLGRGRISAVQEEQLREIYITVKARLAKEGKE